MKGQGLKKIKRNIKRYITLCKRLKKDRRVPKASIILLGMAVAYFVSPIDIIPDFIPVLGQLDDLVLVPLLIFLAIKLIPKEIFAEHYRKVFKK